ncbi:MAG: metallopeptidase family protein [Devosiaceae bacterium]|nr:metallopeptidase family protein [Devosiaceae bacterium MH13]
MGQKLPDFPTTRWSDAMAPSLEDMERMAIDALKTLPEPFRSLAQQTTVRIAEFPDPDVLAEFDVDSPFEIMGLFVGEGMSEGGASPETGRLDNAIWLYRRPMLDYWAEHEETLGSVVRHVFIHELGHHIGLSDDDMERIEAGA